MTAFIQYSNDYESPPSALGGSIAAVPAGPGAAAADFTNRIFEVLAGALTLNNSLFRCKSDTKNPKETRMANVDPTKNGGTWGQNKNSYAYDWAAPVEAAPVRVLIADRFLGNHPDEVMAGYADGHVQNLKYNKVTGGGTPDNNQTFGVGGLYTTHPIFNPDAMGKDDGSSAANADPDNIFSDTGDYTPPAGGGGTTNPNYEVGGASPRRCLLK
jgi:hypothetical protein